LPPLDFALSLGAFGGGNPSGTDVAARPWKFVLVWQNDFTFTQWYPNLFSDLGTDITSYAGAIKQAALQKLKDAYSGSWQDITTGKTIYMPVEVMEGPAGTGDDRATVMNTSPGACGNTYPNDTSINPSGSRFFRVHESTVNYRNNMINAQEAMKLINVSSDAALIQAIGRGIGDIAAHEIAHHFLNNCCTMDSDPNKASAQNPDTTLPDPDAKGAINATGCEASSDSSPWTGYWLNPKIDLHWEPPALKGLTECLSKGWVDFGGGISCHQ
jgi:hypothetical protein